MSRRLAQSSRAISTTSGPAAEMGVSFAMEVVEHLVVPGIPDVLLAGPIRSGVCRKGDRLRLRGISVDREVVCAGIELFNWGPD